MRSRRFRGLLAGLVTGSANHNTCNGSSAGESDAALRAALTQADGVAFLLEGHVEPAYNGLYIRVGETPDGFPRFRNSSGMHLYRYQDYEQWFLWRVRYCIACVAATRV